MQKLILITIALVCLNATAIETPAAPAATDPSSPAATATPVPEVTTSAPPAPAFETNTPSPAPPAPASETNAPSPAAAAAPAPALGSLLIPEAPAAFHLETRDDHVCKIEANGGEPLCYRRAGTAEAWPGLPAEIELVAKIRRLQELTPDGNTESLELENMSEVGAAYFMRPEDRKLILETFSTLTVHDVGLDINHVTKGPAGSQVPFFAAVTWRAFDGREGTLSAQGLVTIADNTLDIGHSNDEVIQKMSEMIQLGIVSVTAPLPWRGDEASASADFLRQTIAPAIGGGYLVLPIALSFAESLVEVVKAIGKALSPNPAEPAPAPVESAPPPAPTPAPAEPNPAPAPAPTSTPAPLAAA